MPARPDPPAARPLDLPRLVMRRARAVALGFLALAAALGLFATRVDTQDEEAGALALATAAGVLHALPAQDAQAIAALRRLGPLRHVVLRVTDARGAVLFDTTPAEPAAPQRWLMRGPWRAVTRAGQSVSWSLPRASGGAWTATLTANARSEEAEALRNLLGLFALLAACSGFMLMAMRHNVRRALAPLHELLAAISRIERGDLAAVRALPAMPVHELESISVALQHLARSLEQAEQARKLLAAQVLTLQEDERHRLAAELHDEFGQRLTALRADASWLRRRLPDDAQAAAVAADMADSLGAIQQDVRGLLARLQPLGPGESAEPLSRLRALLESLAASWSRPQGLQCAARLALAGEDRLLPRAVALVVYRISQEAFTNAARHAGAQRVEVALQVLDDGAGCRLDWSVRDDGRGLADPDAAWQRGSGLAGIRERVWSLGGEFDFEPAGAGAWPGLALHARVRCRTPGESTDAP